MIGPYFTSTDGRTFRLTLQGTLVPVGQPARGRPAAPRPTPKLTEGEPGR